MLLILDCNINVFNLSEPPQDASVFRRQESEIADGDADLKASKGDRLGGTASRGLHGEGKTGL